MTETFNGVALDSGAVTDQGAVFIDGNNANETHQDHHLLHLTHHEHSPAQHKWLVIRNVFVALAAVLFVSSLLSETIIGHSSYLLKGIAYMFGAMAYGSEFIVLTDVFKKKQSAKELFMPCVFLVLYIILGISYFKH